MIAITHLPSPEMGQCQLTHLERVPINSALASRQHEDYRAALATCGAIVVVLDTNLAHPDCVFVEDTAIVLDEVAIVTPMGTAARAAEPAGIEPELRKHRKIVRIERPASLEGGDVLRLGRTLYVGCSGRTNMAGVVALQQAVERFGYRVVPTSVTGCLHLKTAATALPDDSLLVNPDWLSHDAFLGIERINVVEPWSANVVRIGTNVIASAAYPRTIELLRERGITVQTVNLSEFAKAEGAVTCLSLLIL